MQEKTMIALGRTLAICVTILLGAVLFIQKTNAAELTLEDSQPTGTGDYFVAQHTDSASIPGIRITITHEFHLKRVELYGPGSNSTSTKMFLIRGNGTNQPSTLSGATTNPCIASPYCLGSVWGATYSTTTTRYGWDFNTNPRMETGQEYWIVLTDPLQETQEDYQRYYAVHTGDLTGFYAVKKAPWSNVRSWSNAVCPGSYPCAPVYWLYSEGVTATNTSIQEYDYSTTTTPWLYIQYPQETYTQTYVLKPDTYQFRFRGYANQDNTLWLYNSSTDPGTLEGTDNIYGATPTTEAYYWNKGLQDTTRDITISDGETRFFTASLWDPGGAYMKIYWTVIGDISAPTIATSTPSTIGSNAAGTGFCARMTCPLPYINWDICKNIGNLCLDLTTASQEAIQSMIHDVTSTPPYAYGFQIYDSFHNAATTSATSSVSLEYKPNFFGTNVTLMNSNVSTTMTTIMDYDSWSSVRPLFNMVLHIGFFSYLLSLVI